MRKTEFITCQKCDSLNQKTNATASTVQNGNVSVYLSLLYLAIWTKAHGIHLTHIQIYFVRIDIVEFTSDSCYVICNWLVLNILWEYLQAILLAHQSKAAKGVLGQTVRL